MFLSIENSALLLTSHISAEFKVHCASVLWPLVAAEDVADLVDRNSSGVTVCAVTITGNNMMKSNLVLLMLRLNETPSNVSLLCSCHSPNSRLLFYCYKL